MNYSYDYYQLTHSYTPYPSWIKCEHYENCASFLKIFSLFS